jgi:murein DD-endopeptidase MepM/ murein hydrolase activator NlpD
MQDENGNEIRYSHLQNIGVKAGDVLGFGDIVGTRGNTGNVKGANGETLTAEQLKAGRGAHLDVEIKSGGKLLSNADQVNFLKGLKAGGTGMS